jgi:preprotein translocase SecE subunit
MFKALLNLPQTAIAYIKNTIVELRKVDWLAPKQVLKLTVIVIAVAVCSTLLILGMDWLFVTGRNLLFTL